MGVSGSGKSTVGRRVAERAGCGFVDADDFHSEANRRKMASGLPLDDGDRWPWLESLRDRIREMNGRGETLVLACSALKEAYREVLREAGPQVVFVHLRGSREQLLERISAREGHFFPAALLDSQLADLEVPAEALELDISAPAEDLAVQILVPFFNRLP